MLKKDGTPVASVLNVDEMEDYVELQDPGLKSQVKKSHQEYRRGKARSTSKFLTELRRSITSSRT